MISVTESGSFDNIMRWLNQAQHINPQSSLQNTGQRTTNALERATPIDRGVTAGSWDFMITSVSRGTELAFTNRSQGGQGYNIVQGIRFGHGTGTGGWVQSYDFVSPIVDDLLESYIKAFVKDVTK